MVRVLKTGRLWLLNGRPLFIPASTLVHLQCDIKIVWPIPNSIEKKKGGGGEEGANFSAWNGTRLTKLDDDVAGVVNDDLF